MSKEKNKRRSQKQRVFQLMVQNGCITRNEMRWQHRILEPAARITELRQEGVPIIGEKTDDGDYRYALPADYRNEVREIDGAVQLLRERGIKVSV